MTGLFWESLKSMILYYQMALRLIWRGKVPADMALAMASEGQTRGAEARCLYELAREASPEGVIVEIGSYRGRATIALAKGSFRGPRIPVYAVDPHGFFPAGGASPAKAENYGPRDRAAFLRNVLFSGAAPMIHPIALPSKQAAAGWKQPISLLWIDGCHDYESVREDFLSWAPFVLPGGWVAFHDSSDPAGGPYRVIQEALAGGRFRLLRKAEKVSVLCKI
jgi:hypothetical protein